MVPWTRWYPRGTDPLYTWCPGHGGTLEEPILSIHGALDTVVPQRNRSSLYMVPWTRGYPRNRSSYMVPWTRWYPRGTDPLYTWCPGHGGTQRNRSSLYMVPWTRWYPRGTDPLYTWCPGHGGTLGTDPLYTWCPGHGGTPEEPILSIHGALDTVVP